MSHGHSHPHGAHDHAHGGANARRYGMAFALGTALNLGFVAIEVAFGFLSNSVALLADAAVSAGVVIAAMGLMLTGWPWLDPLVSLIIAAVIVWSTRGLLRDSIHMSMKAVPPAIDPAAVRAYLEGQAGVARLHDLHIWPMSTTETALTCHLVMPGAYPPDAFMVGVTRELRERFGIGHATIQIETSEAFACALEPDGVI